MANLQWFLTFSYATTFSWSSRGSATFCYDRQQAAVIDCINFWWQSWLLRFGHAPHKTLLSNHVIAAQNLLHLSLSLRHENMGQRDPRPTSRMGGKQREEEKKCLGTVSSSSKHKNLSWPSKKNWEKFRRFLRFCCTVITHNYTADNLANSEEGKTFLSWSSQFSWISIAGLFECCGSKQKKYFWNFFPHK